MSDTNFQVEILRDRKGIYGIGVTNDNPTKLKRLIIRPDKLLRSKTDCAALQMIPGGRSQYWFKHTLEEHFRNIIHFGILNRKGFPWISELGWIGEKPKNRAKYHFEYHGTRQASRKVINRLIHAALEDAADPNALAMARRFSLKYRYDIYHATTLSHRALQFIEVFPALGLKIYGRRVEQEHEPLVQGAKRLVEIGAPLRTIAALMEVPMAFRPVKPGAANLALRVIDAIQDPRLVDAYLPDTLPKMRNWFEFIIEAERGGSEFVDWVARRAWEIEGSRHEVCGSCSGTYDQSSWTGQLRHVFEAP